MRTKRLVLMALLTAIALTIFWVEQQFPLPIPIPGIKLGLSNIVTLFAIVFLGWREAAVILIMRNGEAAEEFCEEMREMLG